MRASIAAAYFFVVVFVVRCVNNIAGTKPASTCNEHADAVAGIFTKEAP